MRFSALFMTIFVSFAAIADSGQSGTQGREGNSGSNGANGGIILKGFKCVVSTNLKHFQMCLDDGVSVNQIKINIHQNIFHYTIQTRDLPMLNLIIQNPDLSNRPNLRLRYTNTSPGTRELNVYELILFERLQKNSHGEPFEMDNQRLSDMLYVDSNQLDRLKIILSIENDKSALREETQELLVHLKNSKYNLTEVVQVIEEALKD